MEKYYSRRIAQQLLRDLFLFLLLQTISCFRLGAAARLHGEANTTTDVLITSTCRHTEYFDICMSTLQSYPDGRNADVKGLSLISLDACITHAEGTISYVRQQLTSPAAGDQYETRCLDDCATEYDDALDDLRRSVGALQSGDYDSVNAMVSGAMTDADSCEGGFGERPGYSSPAPLTERNDYFSKLCSNSLAIAGLLS